MLAGMRRLFALLVLVAFASAPTFSRTLHVCRMSGEETSACAAAAGSAIPVISDDGCCEKRVLTAAGQARQSAAPESLRSPPVLVALFAGAPIAAGLSFAAALPKQPARAHGPPRFVIHRALLI
jgi:hypothetical protein